eukprot:SAG31_NODE_303_length_18065_cov_5.733107_1_plen_68_part_00
MLRCANCTIFSCLKALTSAAFAGQAYNICLFYLPSVQREYAAAHNGSKSSVKANDVCALLEISALHI